MQPMTSRRGFLRAAAVLALSKLLQMWPLGAAAEAQAAEQKRIKDPAQTNELAWSNEWNPAPPDSSSDERVLLKLVVTNMATNEQSYLVLDTGERYLVELSGG